MCERHLAMSSQCSATVSRKWPERASDRHADRVSEGEGDAPMRRQCIARSAGYRNAMAQMSVTFPSLVGIPKGYVRDAATYRPRPRIARACSVDSSVLREANLSLTASILGVFMKIRNTSILFSKRFWVVSASLLANLLTTFGHYRPCMLC